MRSNYKQLGQYIQVVNRRNKQLEVEKLLGVSIKKILMPSIANTVGTNMRTYKIINKYQFAYGPVTSRNGNKISVALLEEFDKAIVSQAYVVFEIKDHQDLDPEYLMMWFRRPEFDRYARFKSHGSARETFDWDEMCEVELPVPTIQKQHEIVKEYNTIVNRIKLNEQLNKKLEETAQAIYKHWFVDFEFPFDFAQGKPDENGKPYKSNGGKMVWNEELGKDLPVGWEMKELKYFLEVKYGKDYKKLGDGDIPLYGSGGIMKYVDTFLYNEPSVLIPRKGTLTNIMYVDDPFWSVDTMFFTKIKQDCFGFYSFYFLKTLDFNALNVGSAVPSMTTNLLNSMRLILPTNSTLEDFNKKLSSLFQFKKNNSINNSKLNQLESLILSKMTKPKTAQ